MKNWETSEIRTRLKIMGMSIRMVDWNVKSSILAKDLLFLFPLKFQTNSTSILCNLFINWFWNYDNDFIVEMEITMVTDIKFYKSQNTRKIVQLRRLHGIIHSIIPAINTFLKNMEVWCEASIHLVKIIKPKPKKRGCY